ncbi:MAG: T9SS C-terminal target domain-containing protein, partial [Cytophagia bacterium]|nr:T9SS C-terminal target domain-containing protein [Cytophagia bacterium]
AVLDDEEIYELGEYFLSDVDDFTKGTVVFPLRDLKPGKHRIKVMAWDTHNNPGEATVDFVVSDGNVMVIEEFGNYPNPFSNESTLFFTHNTAGEDVSAQIVIYSPQGDQIFSETIVNENSAFRVDLTTLKRNDLKAGVYIARLFLRSETSGRKASAQAKLIILN